MNYKNETGKDIQLPINSESTASGVVRPVNHIAVKVGQVIEVKGSEKYAIGMGLTKTDEKVKVIPTVGKVTDKVVETKQIEKVVEEEAEPLPTEEELFDLNKGQQIKLLKKLGAESIPRYEEDRVMLIQKLQEAK